MKKTVLICFSLMLLALTPMNAFAKAHHEISRYPAPKVEDMPQDLKDISLAAKKARGFVPNVLRALAHRPDEMRAFLAYNKATMHKKSGLSEEDKQLIIVAHSAENGCTYCVQSHSAAYRMASKTPNVADQVAVNYLEADITPRQKAMIDFALKVTLNSRAINEGDFKILKSHGFSSEDIWDIASITAFFNMSNRMMNFLAVRPDEEFYTMGR